MIDWRRIEERITQCTPCTRRPVAVTFLDLPPEGVPKFTGAEPAGCSFWRLAAEGRTFYTVPSDHFNCAVGSYTHNFDLPPERANVVAQPETIDNTGSGDERKRRRQPRGPVRSRADEQPVARPPTPLTGVSNPRGSSHAAR